MKDDLDDLSARARRHELSSSDSRKLDQLLESSAEARLWHQVGAEFDAEDTVQPGDHAASERVIARLLRDLPRKKPRSRVRYVALLVAATLLVASAAAAGVLGVRHFRAQSDAPVATQGRLSTQAPSASPLPLAPSPQASSVLAPEPEPPPAQDANKLGRLAPSTPRASSDTSASGPADLFSAAGQARRQGYTSQAIALLNTLQTRFPNSPEARTSEITLGMMQLKSGGAASALPHFDHYLQRSPHGDLAAEATWGRAQALFALGNTAEARRSLSTLLDRYPASSYASAARAKLRATE